MWQRALLLAGASLAAYGAASTTLTSPVRACEVHEAKGPCTTENFAYERVEKACEEKGRRGAASAMRMMMLKANQKRAGLLCTSCHEDPDEQNYALNDDAHDLAAKWFADEERAK